VKTSPAPSKRRTAIVFLNGHYHAGDKAYLRKLLASLKPSPLIVAADGGLGFLQKTGLRPNVWLTDLDSAPKLKRAFLVGTEVLLYPPEKDKTDGHIALEFCRRRGMSRVIFFGWYDRSDETDHLLGNLLLGCLPELARTKIDLCYLGSRQEVHPLRRGRLIVRNRRGWRFSVVPLDRRVRLSLSGVAYPAESLVISAGDTRPLRNRIVTDRAVVAATGMILVVLSRPASVH
jgi:thiamine pyrophosphokinase